MSVSRVLLFGKAVAGAPQALLAVYPPKLSGITIVFLRTRQTPMRLLAKNSLSVLRHIQITTERSGNGPKNLRRLCTLANLQAAERAPEPGPSAPDPNAAVLPFESSEAKWLRKTLTDDDHQLVDEYEAARRRDDDAATVDALHAALEKATLQYLRDEDSIKKHEGAGGTSWKGTESNAGVLTTATARATYLRRCSTDRVYSTHGYSLPAFTRKRLAGTELRKWLRGEADLAAVDLAALFAKCRLRKEKVQRPSGHNPAKRPSGAEMVSGVIGSERVRQALLPTEQEKQQRTIEDLQKKLAAAIAAQSAGASAQARPAPAARGAARPTASRGARRRKTP